MLRKFFRKLSLLGDAKISNKIIYIYIMGGLIPLLLLSVYFIGFTRNNMIEQATDEALNNAVRLEERIQETLRTAVNVSDGIYLDADLRHLVKKQYIHTEDIIYDLNNFSTFDEYLRLYDELDSIRIYIENASILDDAQIIKTKASHRESDWYQKAIEMDGRVAFVYRYDEIKMSNHIAMVRLIKDNQGIKVGVLVINISNIALRKMIESEPYEIIGVLDDQRVFISTNASYEGIHSLDVNEIKQLLNLNAVINDYRGQNGRFKVIFKKFDAHSTEYEISLLTLIPTKQFLTKANQSIRSSVVLIFLSIMTALFMVIRLTKRLSRRIGLFRTSMHQVAIGEFNVNYTQSHSDEIDLLFQDLNIMSSNLKSLMEKVFQEGQYREQLIVKQKEVEFKMLTSQIDPHFLYNTLETIRMEAIINDQYSIAEIVKKLAFIMRRKLSVSHQEVTLASELELLTHYLEIQKFRFGDRVSYDIYNSCAEKDYLILPLLLQPIVENAFIHGLEKSIGVGKIMIQIKDDSEFLEITIEDNGVGISQEKLLTIMEKMEADRSSHNESIGMSNVYQRVKLYYGKPYKIEIDSTLNEGTVVKFFLPKKIEA